MKPLSTVDPAEAARFEKLANLWWDASGPFWPLHAMQSLRPDPDFNFWEAPSGWWLQRRAAALAKLDILPSGEPIPKDKAA